MDALKCALKAKIKISVYIIVVVLLDLLISGLMIGMMGVIEFLLDISGFGTSLFAQLIHCCSGAFIIILYILFVGVNLFLSANYLKDDVYWMLHEGSELYQKSEVEGNE